MLQNLIFPVHPDPGMAKLAPGLNDYDHDKKPVFRLATDSDGRIDGSIPVWDSNPKASDEVSNVLANAKRIKPSFSPQGQALADTPAISQEEPFGFNDLIDMINPLQHIPLINTVYRYLTHDTIKPVSQAVGGTIYGGPLGAAASLVNIIVKEGTGRDIAGNLTALAFNSERLPAAKFQQETKTGTALDNPSELPGTVISFVALSSPQAESVALRPLPLPTQRLALADFSPFEIY